MRSVLRSIWRSRVRPRVAATAWLFFPTLMRWRLSRKAARRSPFDKLYHLGDPLLLAAEAGHLEYRPLMSVLMAVHDTKPRRLHRTVDSLLAQAYEQWELIFCLDGSTRKKTLAAVEGLARLDPRIHTHCLETAGGVAAATNAALTCARGEYVALLDHDDELLPAALLEVAKTLNSDHKLDVVYTDQDYIEADGSVAQTFYKPDWSLEFFRGVMYVGQLLVVRRSLAATVGGLDATYDSVREFEFMLRLAEKTDRIAHIAQILYERRKTRGRVIAGSCAAGDRERLQATAVNAHLARCGVEAIARPNPQHPCRLLVVPKPRTRDPLISIVVRASGAENHLGVCCERILSGAYPNREVIVVGGRLSSDLERHLEALGAVLEASGESGGAAALAGTNKARGELVVCMTGDLHIQTPDWLDHLLFSCGLPGVACVTPLILSSEGTVSSAGHILGGTEMVVPALRGLPPGSDGYAGSLSCTREVSAVPADCYAVSRRVLQDLGGLCPYFAGEHYQTVDLCLRARTAGLRNLFTPRAVTRHLAPVAHAQQQDDLDKSLCADAWGALVAKGDPFHNRNFQVAAPGFQI